MAARVQIVVEAKDATSGVFRAITSELGAFGGLVEELTSKQVNWGNVGQQAAQMVINGIKDSIKATTEYAREVRDLALASGQGAEESSRMLQVLDDYQLTAEDAKTATRALTKEGLAPTVETIAKLSEEYQKLNTVEERNAFVQKNLGRAGQEWLNLLNQGPEAIRAMNDAVADGLVLTEENIRAAEEYRLALDEWNDSVQILKISIGNELLPVLTDLINKDFGQAMERGANATGVAGLAVKTFTQEMALSRAEIEATKDQLPGLDSAFDTTALSVNELAEREKLLAEQAKAISAENSQFISVLGQVKSALDTYNEGLAQADIALANGDMSVQEHAARVGELSAAYREASNQIVLSIVEMKLATDGWSDAELNAYLQVGKNLGVFNNQQIAAAKGAIQTADALLNASSQIYHTGERAVDAGENFGVMAEGAEAMGQSIAGSATPAVAGLKSVINQLPTQWNIDIFVRTHGSIPKFAGAMTQAPVALAPGEQGVNINNQMGGEVFAGQPTWIGEGGGREAFVPQQNGRILSQSEATHALSGMGGGNRNYFYGPVTLQIGEDGASGIMGMR